MYFNCNVLDCETTHFTDATDYSSGPLNVKSGLNSGVFCDGEKTLYNSWLTTVYWSVQLSVDCRYTQQV